MAGDPNGRQPEEASDADLLAALQAGLLAELRVVLGLFAPSFDPALVPALAARLFEEQQLLQTNLLPILVNGVGQVRLDVKDVGGRAGSFIAQASLSVGQHDCGVALPTALIYAIVMQPSIRALLAVYGIAYKFVHIRPAPEPLVRLS